MNKENIIKLVGNQIQDIIALETIRSYTSEATQLSIWISLIKTTKSMCRIYMYILCGRIKLYRTGSIC